MAAYEEATGHILIIYQRSNPNLFMDFMTWVRLQAQDKKEIQKKRTLEPSSFPLNVLGDVIKGGPASVPSAVFYLIMGRASEGGYGFLFVTDEQFSKCCVQARKTEPSAKLETSSTP